MDIHENYAIHSLSNKSDLPFSIKTETQLYLIRKYNRETYDMIRLLFQTLMNYVKK